MIQHDSNSNRAIALWLISGALFTALIIIVGGITRLTGSGLSITEWQVFSGIIPPLTESAWKEAFDLYRQTPEYQKVNYGMSLAEFRWIYFWEYLHRLLARGLGVIFIVPFAYFLWKKQLATKNLPPLLGLFLLGALQGYAGWWMVQSGLVHTPFVSHLRLAFHLVLGFTISGWALYLGLLWWPKAPENTGNTPAWFKKYVLLFLALLAVQIVWGAFVAGLKAGYAYPSWPMMGSSLIPAELGNEGYFWKDLVFNPVTVQFVHRWLAFLLIPLPALLWWNTQKSSALSHLRKPVLILVGLIVLQIVLGIATLIFHIPSAFAVIHQLTAILILWSTIWLLSR